MFHVDCGGKYVSAKTKISEVRDGHRHVARIWPGGGGGAEVSRRPRKPLPKTKKSADLAHYFSGGAQIHKNVGILKAPKLETAH